MTKKKRKKTKEDERRGMKEKEWRETESEKGLKGSSKGVSQRGGKKKENERGEGVGER